MNLSKIDTLSSELKTLPTLTQGEHNRINGDFAIEYVYNSNAIERNSLTLRETALVLQHGVVVAGKPLKDHIEAVGHLDAYNLALKLVSENEPISEKIIKRLHSLVLMNDNANRGFYRNVPVTILGAGFDPPPPELIPAQMERLISDYTAQLSKLHVIEAISLFHLQFEAIHPFIDGNGRVGRLLLNMES